MFSLIVRQELLCIFIAILYILSLIVDQGKTFNTYFKNLLSDNNLSICIKLSSKIKLFKVIR